ncbi:unnamed protein product, partial [Didymodactylos carnosus]
DANIDDQPRTIIDSYHSETGEKYLEQTKIYPELPMYYIQSLYYFLGHLKETFVNGKITFLDICNLDLVQNVQQILLAIRESARTNDIVQLSNNRK